MSKYQVLVGNIGQVYDGDNLTEAKEEYDDYCWFSNEGYGRAAGEDVTLITDGEPELELVGKISQQEAKNV